MVPDRLKVTWSTEGYINKNLMLSAIGGARVEKFAVTFYNLNLGVFT